MVDWEARKFLWLFLGIQLAVLGLVGLAILGFDIVVLRRLLGFAYLTFIPGIVILRLLKFRRSGTVETLLYSVGLSLAFNMLLGLVINTVYPLIGISNPISIYPIVITWAIVLGILCLLDYRRKHNDLSASSQFKMGDLFSPPALFLSLLPLLAVLGTSVVNSSYHDNIVLLVMIGLIALTVILVTFTRFIPARFYPFAVFSIALSMLWHWSLISPHLWGWDIHIEYYYQRLVLTNSFWNSSLYNDLNSALSVVMLAPIYSLLLNMDTVWIFKIITPFLFSLVPVALFQVYRKQTDDRIAFSAVFFFISFYGFFSGMVDLTRMQIAELFFALSILLLSDREMVVTRRIPLLIIFSFAIAVSHYGLSYFYLFYLILALLLLSLARSNVLIKLSRGLSGKFGGGEDDTVVGNPSSTSARKLPDTHALSLSFVLLVVVFFLTWFMYITGGSAFSNIPHVGRLFYSHLAEFLDPQSRDPATLIAIGLASPEIISLQRYLYLITQYIIQFFIVAGVIGLLFNLRKTRFQPVYVAMTLGSALLLLLIIILPYFALPFNVARIYQITLFFLAPFCVLGGMMVFRRLLRLVPSRLFRTSTERPLYLNLVVILVLIPYFLFSTAFIYVITGDRVTSMALNPELDQPRFNREEVSGKEWLLQSMTAGSGVFADRFGSYLLYENIDFWDITIFDGSTAKVLDNTYVFLRSLNVKRGEVKQGLKYVDLQSSTFGREVLTRLSKIYDNGGAQVLK